MAWAYDPHPYDVHFQKYGQQYGLDPGMLRVQAQIESSLNPEAVSPAGARGVSQFMPETGAAYGLKTPQDFFDPEKSIAAQARYMKNLLGQFEGNQEHALAAYNMGPTALRRAGLDYSGVPETSGYLKRFNELYKKPMDIVKPAIQRAREAVGVKAELPGGTAMERARKALSGVFQKDEPAIERARRMFAEPGEPQMYENPYPKGSREYFEYGKKYGAQPAITPQRTVVGEPLPAKPGTDYPPTAQEGPMQFMARVVEVTDADTIQIEEMGTGTVSPLRLLDVNVAELGTEAGEYAKSYLESMVSPGDQVVIESAVGTPLGAHGRPLGKAYIRTADGRQIDLSTPVQPLGVEQSDEIRSDFLAGTGEQKTTTGVRAHLGSAAMDVLELGQFASDLGDWVFWNDPDRGPIDQKMDLWHDKLKEAQSSWVARNYDPDAKTYELPLVGSVTLGELGGALTTSTAYTLGLTWGVSKLLKVGTRGLRALKVMKDPALFSRAGELSEYALGMRRAVAKEGAGAAEAAQKLQKISDDLEGIDNLVNKGVHVLEPVGKGWSDMTAMQRLRQLKDSWITSATDKYHPIARIAKDLGDKETGMLINNVRAAGDRSRAALTQGVYQYVPDGKGGEALTKVYDALSDIWQLTDGVMMGHSGAFMQSERVLFDLLPRWIKALDETNGNISAARKIAPEVTDVQVDFHKQLIGKIESFWKENPQGPQVWDTMKDKMRRSREWMDAATMTPLIEAGYVTADDVAKMRAVGGAYAPLHRLSISDLSRILGPDAIADIIKVEKEMLQGSETAAFAIAGASQAATQTKPMGRLRNAWGPKKTVKKMLDDGTAVEEFEPAVVGDMTVDMWQAVMTRIPALRRAADQQMVRNKLGVMIDDMAKQGDDWATKYTHKVAAEADPQLADRVARGLVDNAFVRYEDGKRFIYSTTDKALGDTLRAMSPSQMGLFKKMMTTKGLNMFPGAARLFRAGTVLGPHFMMRNPMRDQFMAATLTKYGYVPVVDWWRGISHVLRDSDLYKGIKAGGGSQAGYVSADIEATRKGIVDMHSNEGLTDLLRHAMKGQEGEKGVSHFLDTLSDAKRWRQAWKKSTGYNVYYDPKNGKVKNSYKATLHNLQQLSELFEEGTRVGAVAKAVKRAKSGKKYTVLRALDEAAGGMSGWYKLATRRGGYKGFGARYKQARFTDDTRLTADMMDEARNITIDFGKFGTEGETINAIYPFFNAELQDYSRFNRAMREAPLTTAARAFTFVTVPSLANWYLNFDNPAYQGMGEVEKDLFLHPFGYNEEYKKFGRVSRPIGTISALFGLVPSKAMDWLAANDPAAVKALEEELWPGQSLRHMRNQFQEGLSDVTHEMDPAIRKAMGLASMGYFPMQGYEQPIQQPADTLGNPYVKDMPVLEYLADEARSYMQEQTVGRYLPTNEAGLAPTAPQLVSPLMQVQANENVFFGGPITPNRIAGANLLPQDEITETTGFFEQMISRAVNMVSPMDVNPMEAAFLIRTYTGSLGSMALAGGNDIAEYLGLGQQRPQLPEDPTTGTLSRAFWSRQIYGADSEPVRRLYEEWEDIERVLNSMQHAKGGADVDRFLEIRKDHPEWIAGSLLKDTIEGMGDFHKVRRAIRNNPNLSPEEKADQLMKIDMALTQYAHIRLNAYYKVDRDPSILEGLLGGY